MEKQIRIRLNIMLAIGVGSIIMGMWNLHNENDLFAIINFVLAGISFWTYLRLKARFQMVKEKTWRSYDPR